MKEFLKIFAIFIFLLIITGCSQESSNPDEAVSSDASSSQSLEPAESPASAEGSYGSKGFILVSEQKYEYDVAKVEGNSMLDKQGEDPNNFITAYGYVTFYGDLPNDPMEALRFSINPGDIHTSEYSTRVYTDINLQFDVVVNPQNMNEQEFKQIKMALLKSQSSKAFVKIVGRFGLYSDTYKLFIGAKSIDIVAEEPKD
jgi:hypothetical protein